MTTINITSGTINPYFDYSNHSPASQLGDAWKVGKYHLLLVTDKQGRSFDRVVRHQGADTYEGAHYDHLDNILVVQFKHVYIGIEPDGYAHS